MKVPFSLALLATMSSTTTPQAGVQQGLCPASSSSMTCPMSGSCSTDSDKGESEKDMMKNGQPMPKKS